MRLIAASLVAALTVAACTGADSTEVQGDTLVADGPLGSFELTVETLRSVEVGDDRMLYRYDVRNLSAEGQSVAMDVRLDGVPDDCDLDEGLPWSEVGPYAQYPRFNIEVGEQGAATKLSNIAEECVGTFDAVFRLTVVGRDDPDQVLASDSVLRVPITIVS